MAGDAYAIPPGHDAWAGNDETFVGYEIMSAATYAEDWPQFRGPTGQGHSTERGLPLSLLARLLCEAPARRFGLWPRKGGLVPGADADLVVFDPERSREVDPLALVSAGGWSPYSGRRLRGAVARTFVRGNEVFDGEGVVGEPGWGSHVKPGPVAEHAHA